MKSFIIFYHFNVRRAVPIPKRLGKYDYNIEIVNNIHGNEIVILTIIKTGKTIKFDGYTNRWSRDKIT